MPDFVKPKYIDPAQVSGDEPLMLRPPLLFREVTARVFPLKANMARLTQFCDQFLNMDIPDHFVRFSPALPYVYFMVLNYGGMSATSLAAQRTGWVAQHEVFFLIPLQRWRRENGRLVFKDWATVSPFIFVDDQMSQTTGREVYGWQKVLAHIDADKPLWTTHPRAPSRLFTMSTQMFADLYEGQEEKLRVLVTVDRDPVASYAEFPADLKCPWSPTSLYPNVIRSSLSLMGEAIDMAAGFRLRGYPPGRDLGSLWGMTKRAYSMTETMLTGLLLPALGNLVGRGKSASDPYGSGSGLPPSEAPRFFTNTLNLKQFRDPESPDLSCYTALVNSAMGIDRVNQIGLLGDWDLLRGDPSGGYSVSIHRYHAQPIIEALGIEVPNNYQDSKEGDVVTLRPRFPFWMDVDLYYGAGDVICSRTSKLHSRDDHGGDDTKAKLGVWIDEETGQSAESDQDSRDKVRRPAKAPNAFNNALGAATQPVIGPFHFPDVTMQVYPLLADRAKLDRFVDECWNRPFRDAHSEAGLSLGTLGSYVYMIVTVNGDQRGAMWSNNNNIGSWSEREVSFSIPVKWRRGKDLISLAMIEPFVYADSGRAVITDREVNGRNSVVATIDSPEDIWMAPKGPIGPRRLVRVATETFTALNIGQTALQRTLVQVDERDVLPPRDDEGWRAVADGWGRVAADDLKRKTWLASSQREHVQNLRALALEILAHQAPVNRITMKQYRDAHDMDRACYQAAVHTRRAITRVYDVREIDQRVHVRLHRLPDHPIVDTLGLSVKSVDSGDGAVVDNLQPIRPFWMHLAVKEELGRIIGTVDPRKTRKTLDKKSDGSDRHWVFTHPWFRADPSPETDADGSLGNPFFLPDGPTHICPGWLETYMTSARNCQDLCDKTDRWLRTALTNELALQKAVIDALPEDEKQQLENYIPAASANRGPFFGLREAAAIPSRVPGVKSFRSFCDSMSLERMASLVQTIEQAFDQRKLKKNDFPDITEQAHLTTNRILIESLSESERESLKGLFELPKEDELKPSEEERAWYDSYFEAPEVPQPTATIQAPPLPAKPESSKRPAKGESFGSFVKSAPPEKLTSFNYKIFRAITDFNLAPERHMALIAVAERADLDRAPESTGRESLLTMLRRVETWIILAAASGSEPWDQQIPWEASESIQNVRNKRLRIENVFEPERRLLLEMALDFGVWSALEDLIRISDGSELTPHPSFHDVQREYERAVLYDEKPLPMNPTAVLRVVSDELGACVDNWTKPIRWRRLTRNVAAKAADEVGDIQLVIETILGDQWESKQVVARANDRPHHHMPVSTVGPIGDPGNPWARSRGLDRWRENGPDQGGRWDFFATQSSKAE